MNKRQNNKHCTIMRTRKFLPSLSSFCIHEDRYEVVWGSGKFEHFHNFEFINVFMANFTGASTRWFSAFLLFLHCSIIWIFSSINWIHWTMIFLLLLSELIKALHFFQASWLAVFKFQSKKRTIKNGLQWIAQWTPRNRFGSRKNFFVHKHIDFMFILSWRAESRVSWAGWMFEQWVKLPTANASREETL